MMATQRIQLTEWLPDQPGISGALTDAKNVVSQAIGYGPFPSATTFSQSAAEDLTTLYAAKDTSGATKLFAAGASKMYSVSGVGVLTDVSRFTGTYSQSGTTTLTVTSSGHKLKTGDTIYLDFTSGTATDGSFTVTVVDANTFTVTTTSATTSGNVTIKVSSTDYTTQSGDRVRFTQFGRTIISTNNSQRLQYWDLTSSTAFKNLSDSAPIAKYITVVRDFVVVANTNEGSQQPYRVRWSALSNETDWVENVNTQSDYQDIPDGGQIVGIRGGEFGVIFLDRAIHRMSYVGTPFIFQFDNISRNKGCIASGSIAQYQGISFFLSDDGFYMCDGQQVTPIGAEKVDRFFFNDASEFDFPSMSAAVDPVRKLVIWNYKGVDGNRHLIIYNFATKKWTYADAGTDYISESSTSSSTLEELDTLSASIDALAISLDSLMFMGGKYFLGGTKGTNVMTYTGSNLTGRIATGDLGGQGRSVMTLVRPQVDNGSASIAVSSRTLLSEQVTYGTAVSASSENRVSLRSSGNYHRVQLNPTGNNWKNASAIDVDIVPQGVR
jgi:hypothetical protein